MTGVIVEDAASSVFPLHDVLHDGGLYVQDSEGAVVYKDGKATHMVPRGKLYAFPTGKTQACQDLEAHAGLVKAIKVKEGEGGACEAHGIEALEEGSHA